MIVLESTAGLLEIYTVSTLNDGVVAYYNGATTPSNLALTQSSPTSSNGAVMAQGFAFGTGYAVLAGYAVSSGMTYVTQAYYSNGTLNTIATSSQTHSWNVRNFHRSHQLR